MKNVSTLSAFVEKEKSTKSIDDLSTDGLVLFNFLAHIIDIKYRVKYGRTLERNAGRGYSNKHMKSEDVPGQLPSVDGGLERAAQRRISDGS